MRAQRHWPAPVTSLRLRRLRMSSSVVGVCNAAGERAGWWPGAWAVERPTLNGGPLWLRPLGRHLVHFISKLSPHHFITLKATKDYVNILPPFITSRATKVLIFCHLQIKDCYSLINPLNVTAKKRISLIVEYLYFALEGRTIKHIYLCIYNVQLQIIYKLLTLF